MMSQGVLGFKYERGERETGLTALGGLPLYLELAVVIGLGKSIQSGRARLERCSGGTGADSDESGWWGACGRFEAVGGRRRFLSGTEAGGVSRVAEEGETGAGAAMAERAAADGAVALGRVPVFGGV